MYLPDRLDGAEVLITVKAYPQPSERYEELVCTAGLLNGTKWIRIYPVPFRFLQDNSKFPKYSRIKLDLQRNKRDFRPESYRPKLGVDEKIKIMDKIGTENKWVLRKDYVLREVFHSMNDLLNLAKDPEINKSLAVVKPDKIIYFKVLETQRDWKEKWRKLWKQTSIFDLDSSGNIKKRELLPKLPYEYRYQFFTKGDSNPRIAKIEDWEIGALFWNCLKKYEGDEEKANHKVREKYFEEFINKKDLYFFMGTTLANHIKAPNPFIIIGVFYPPKVSQIPLPFDE